MVTLPDLNTVSCTFLHGSKTTVSPLPLTTFAPVLFPDDNKNAAQLCCTEHAPEALCCRPVAWGAGLPGARGS